MDLDRLKKSELVTVARQLDQEVKLLRGKLTKTVEAPENLPFHAISYIRENSKYYLVKLKFDSETGMGKVVSKEEFSLDLLPVVKFKANEFMFMTMDSENRR